jgi:hypothetical protein
MGLVDCFRSSKLDSVGFYRVVPGSFLPEKTGIQGKLLELIKSPGIVRYVPVKNLSKHKLERREMVEDDSIKVLTIDQFLTRKFKSAFLKNFPTPVAVWYFAGFLIIVLMIILGRPEFAGRKNLGRNLVTHFF